MSNCHFADYYGQPEKSANFCIQSITLSTDLRAIFSKGGQPEAISKRHLCKHPRRAAWPKNGLTTPLPPASTRPHSRLPDSLLSFNEGVRDGQEVAVQDAGHRPDGFFAADSAAHGRGPDQGQGAASARGSGQYCQQLSRRAGAGGSLPGDGRGSG